MNSSDIFDKTLWPCFTPGLHWALSDSILNISALSSMDDDSVEYSIDTQNLPDGEHGLWHFNAIRDITFNINDWPLKLKTQIESVTLCLGSQALQTLKLAKDAENTTFTMFSEDFILPLFVVDDDDIKISIQFKDSLEPQDRFMMPKRCLNATGLLVRIKERTKPFFVAGSKESVLTWDGHQSRVFSSAIKRPFDFSSSNQFDATDGAIGANDGTDGTIGGPNQFDVNNEDSTFHELWKALELNRNRPDSKRPTTSRGPQDESPKSMPDLLPASPAEAFSDSPLLNGLITPRPFGPFSGISQN
jgi:hypothetical protein